MITELEAKRRAAERKRDQIEGPRRQLELVELELADLEQQIEAARQQEAAEARERQQHLNNIHMARLAYDATPPALVEAMRSIHFARLRLVDLGEQDPGDRLLSVEAIAAPTVERDQRAAAVVREMEMRGRATPEQEAAARERQILIDQLHVIGRPWDEAERLAAQVESGDLTLEEALSGASEENAHAFTI